MRYTIADFKFNDIAKTIVFEAEGEVVGKVRVARQEIFIGNSSITNGFIGDVAIDPKFQGKGYATRLLHQIVKDMKEKGCDIAKLGGRPDFYRRFGFIELYFPYLTIYVSGSKQVSGQRYSIKEENKIDIHKLSAVYEVCHKNRTGMVKRNKRYWQWLTATKDFWGTGKYHLVTAFDKVNGNLAGYAIYIPAKEFVELGQGHITTIIEIAFLPEEPKAVSEIIGHLLRKISTNSEMALNGNFQYTPLFQEILRNEDIKFELIKGQTMGMVAILNPVSIIKKIGPELLVRIGSSLGPKETFDFSFSVSENVCRLIFADRKVKFDENNRGEFHFPINELTFMNLILGVNTPTELGFQERFKLKEKDIMMLNKLFPRQYPLFSITDSI